MTQVILLKEIFDAFSQELEEVRAWAQPQGLLDLIIFNDLIHNLSFFKLKLDDSEVCSTQIKGQELTILRAI